jgi:hypothetical protein
LDTHTSGRIQWFRRAVQPPQVASYIPRQVIEALGSDIVRAYGAVGGSQRFLHIKGNDHSFLVRVLNVVAARLYATRPAIETK